MIYGVPLLQLSVEVVDLNDNIARKYNALSYTWGSPFPENSPRSAAYRGPDSVRPITVNGRLFYIGRNLFEFLHQTQQTLHNVNRNPAALIKAVQNDDIRQTHALLRKGVNVNVRDTSGASALHYAAEKGNYDAVNALCMYDADPFAQDNSGLTPLVRAVQSQTGQFREVIQLLQMFEYGDELKEAREYKQLKEAHFLSNGRRMWIDAICINQDDIPERNSQVAIMSQIYSKADSVVVWLGVEDEYTASVSEAICGLDSEDWVQHLALASVAEKAEDLSVEAREAISINRFFERTWWKRVWVIQEIALPYKVQMLCGTFEINYVIPLGQIERPMGQLPFRRSIRSWHSGISSMDG
ncbi:heterokaryon incompatibility protein-domain-containing protein [Aspergillus ambiguus]|uniref:heterokaryon incompatibility protein-domain-containing protein n=1 Tax=Aspergillus ambiguus TaxID=176160 RepID=UPI003CCE27B8